MQTIGYKIGYRNIVLFGECSQYLVVTVKVEVVAFKNGIKRMNSIHYTKHRAYTIVAQNARKQTHENVLVSSGVNHSKDYLVCCVSKAQSRRLANDDRPCFYT